MDTDNQKPFCRVLNYDCLDVLKRMPDNSVDAIVTDPPYGISFMGKGFDTFKKEGMTDNQAFQADMTPLFKEMFRVVKPGAHLLAFGGTRTYHRLTCAIEDAGFEVRDCCGWIYSCLSEDTEILTVNGWAKIGTIKIGDYAIAYELKTRTFRVERVENTHIYEYDDTAYNIVSDSTDQLVSRNHRVIVERGGVEMLEFAETLGQGKEICVPILEDMPDVWNNISVPYEGTDNKKSVLHNGVFEESSKNNSKIEERTATKHNMCEMREGVLSSNGMEEEGKGTLLFETLQREGKDSCCNKGEQITPGKIEENRGVETVVEGEIQWSEESSMEGWCNDDTPSRKLQGSSRCSMPKGVCANGEKQWICGRTSSCCGVGNRETSASYGSCTSYKSQPDGQQIGESDVIQDEQRPQTIRGTWRTTTTMARVKPVHYTGMIWCISVPSGTIIARRNNKVFITGNSGFPKSMDISKAIDKKLGAKRPDRGGVGEHEGNIDFGMKNRCPKCGKPYFSANPCTCPRDDLIPITTEAEKWSGWGTCLKPAFEPIVLARKPLDGTVVDNVLKWGVGGLNIDECRVPYEKGGSSATNPLIREMRGCKNNHGADTGSSWRITGEEGKVGHANLTGRFPANLIHDGSDEVLSIFPNNVKGGTWNNTKGAGHFENNGKPTEYTNKGSDDSVGSAARFFYCPKASKKEKGEGNVHPTVKPIELMKYLVKLVTPKGGLVLDPFMGSGSTGVAAIELGRRFLGIEKEPEYFKIAENRLASIDEQTAKQEV